MHLIAAVSPVIVLPSLFSGRIDIHIDTYTA